MKPSVKSLIATGLIALSCTCSAFAAPTVESLVNEIGHGNGFYTLYTGMPIRDFLYNWEDIPGWEHKNTAKEDPQYAQYHYQRQYEINGSVVNEKVDVSTSIQKGSAYHISWRLSSPNGRIIDEISYKIRKELMKVYPEAKNFPNHYLAGKQKLPYIRTERGNEKLYLYNVCEYTSKKQDKVSAYCLTVIYVQDLVER